MTIPTSIIAFSTGLAGFAWIFFAHSQSGRRQAVALGWLCLPFFVLCGIYTWFSFTHAVVDVQTAHARYGIFGISVSQAVILFVLSYWNKVR